ncbi:unnamed protein product [Hermetia illucens]|uniref:Uncharacterized protein n=1 Tax=Hermetia illucens TaxID=343691 RepID=A0A7R8V6Q4_HERIL|nr:unnamed protein product [Hermetia illucens]
MIKAVKEIREIYLSKRCNVDKEATAAILQQVQNLQKICVPPLEKNGDLREQRAAGQAAKVMRPIGVKPAVVIQRAVPTAEKRVPTTFTEVAAMKASPKTRAIEAISRKKKEVFAARITATDKEVDVRKALQHSINPAAQGIKRREQHTK